MPLLITLPLYWTAVQVLENITKPARLQVGQFYDNLIDSIVLKSSFWPVLLLLQTSFLLLFLSSGYGLSEIKMRQVMSP